MVTYPDGSTDTITLDKTITDVDITDKVTPKDPEETDTDGNGKTDIITSNKEDKSQAPTSKDSDNSKVSNKSKVLPKTSAAGSETGSALPAGLAGLLAAAGFLAGKRRRKKD